MPSDRNLTRLEDIRGAIELAEKFTAGLTYDEFERDIMRVYAVTRCLEIVSEASRRLDQSFKDQHPELPWPQIAGAGNVYRHDYPLVRTDIIWDTIKKALPPLLAVVEMELRSKP
ncbi:MAG: DUF86 domain-containing protein [Devosia sp.]|nr:DUF86 domain-containing protein [Devosia sp.]